MALLRVHAGFYCSRSKVKGIEAAGGISFEIVFLLFLSQALGTCMQFSGHIHMTIAVISCLALKCVCPERLVNCCSLSECSHFRVHLKESEGVLSSGPLDLVLGDDCISLCAIDSGTFHSMQCLIQ